MKILTVRQPWAGLIACGQKDVENRTWMPPLHMIGERIGIHAGRLDVARNWSLFEYDDNVLCHVNGAIIATVRIADVLDDSTSRWAMPNNYHWMLDEPRIIKPIATRGHLGLWTYPTPRFVR